MNKDVVIYLMCENLLTVPRQMRRTIDSNYIFRSMISASYHHPPLVPPFNTRNNCRTSFSLYLINVLVFYNRMKCTW